MAKSGFSVSQRRKVETIGAVASKTIAVHDCGTTFVLTTDTARTINLPTAAAAGDGWHCRIVSGATQASNVDIVAPENFAARLCVAADGGPAEVFVTTVNAATLRLVGAVNDVVGDQVELIVINGGWYAYSHSAI
tara:strand:- start:843 stop:1247 length:405 start_codon:yes stop_codon:yes gene_type:complete